MVMIVQLQPFLNEQLPIVIQILSRFVVALLIADTGFRNQRIPHIVNSQTLINLDDAIQVFLNIKALCTCPKKRLVIYTGGYLLHPMPGRGFQNLLNKSISHICLR